MTYEQWMKAVDMEVFAICGLGVYDLPDWSSRDAYEDGLSVKEGAEMCLEDAGYYDFLE